MRNTKKTILVVLLILLIEILYLQVDPISLGFPFRSATYRTWISWDWSGEELPLGLDIEPILLACDILFAFLLALLLIQCVPLFVIVPLLQGFVLGSMIGVIFFLCGSILSDPWSSIITIPLIFLLTPLMIYILSLKNKLQKTAVIIISFMTVTSIYCAFFLIEAILDGADESIHNLRVIPRLLAFACVTVFECFILMLLHKKVLPLMLRKKKICNTPGSMAQDASAAISSSQEKASRNITLKRAILYLSFLAITSYIGHHFVTVRKMQIDEWLVNEAIESKLERLDKFHPKHFETHQEVSSWSMVVEPESFKVGLNASFTTEVDVNDEKYFTKVKKHILVPWLQVEIQKKEDTE